MIKDDYSYQELLIILYFNTYKSSYSYNDLCELLGVNIEVLDKFIGALLNKRVLEYNEENIISVSSIGTSYLKSSNLNELSLDEKLLDGFEHSILINHFPSRINDIYIPKKFNLKFKGNKNYKGSLEKE